ncbi:hypothetical protein BWI92_17735 [Flectobacillus sp. BAB-3569]|nr:hypothetical protein BWI92_17735 [Flectobacillus sp. BAB-3569]
MKKLYHALLLIIIYLSSTATIVSQTITQKESEEIKLSAKRKIQNGFKDLLNFITDESIGDAEKLATIKDSYSNSNIQVFYNSQTILEDDINPNYYNGNNIHDLNVEKYLNALDILYTKSIESSIEINILSVSNVKQVGGTMFIKVYFECLFKNSHRTIKVAYKKNDRVAELKVEHIGKKWITNITRVAFGKVNDETGKNDLAITQVVESATNQPKESEVIQTNESQKDVNEFNRLLADADDAFKAKEYDIALQAYSEVLKKDRDEYGKSFYIKKQISLSKREIQKEQDLKKQEEERLAQKQKEDNYFKVIFEAKTFERKRYYGKAIQQYQAAFRIIPDSAILYQETIRNLNKELSLKTEADEMFLAGNFKELKRKYDAYIKKDQSNSDYFLGRAKCSIQLGDSPKAILEDLDQAISLDFSNTYAFKVRAEFYTSQNNIPKAIADYTNFLNIEHDSASIYAIRATLKTRTNNTQGALEDYEKAIQLDKRNPKYYYERGIIHTQNSSWQKAITDHTEAISIDPKMAQAYYYRGEAYYNLKKYKEAGQDFSRAISLQIDDNLANNIRQHSEEFFLIGDRALENNDIAFAISSFTNSVLILPYNYRSWYKIGESYQKEGKLLEAITNYTTAIKYNDSYDDAYYGRGYAKFYLNRYKEALEDFHKANELVGNYYNAIFYEARTLMLLKNFKSAILLFQKIKIAKSTIEKSYSKDFFANTHLYLGIAMIEEKYIAEASTELSSAIKINPYLSEAYFQRGLVYLQLNNLESALSDLNQTITLGPNNSQKEMAIGNALYNMENYSQATNAFQESINLDTLKSNYYEAHKMKAYCFFKQNQHAEAAQTFVKAIEYKSKQDDSSIYRDLTVSYLFDGQSSKALSVIENVLKTDPENVEINYLLVCYYVQTQSMEIALKILEKLFTLNAVDNNFIKKDRLINTIDSSFKTSKDYKALLKRIAK